MKDHLEYSKQLWWDFVLIANGEVKPMRKPESWASGVEYLVGRLFYDNDSQQEVADSYGISKASLTKRYQEIQQALNITLYYSPWQQSFSVLGDALRNYLGKDSSLWDALDNELIDDDEWSEF